MLIIIPQKFLILYDFPLPIRMYIKISYNNLNIIFFANIITCARFYKEFFKDFLIIFTMNTGTKYILY